MRCFSVYGYTTLVYLLPSIVSFNDIHPDSVVEAASVALRNTDGNTNYNLENENPGALKDPEEKMPKHILKPNDSKLFSSEKLKQISMVGAAVLLVVAIALYGANYRMKHIKPVADVVEYTAKVKKLKKLGQALKSETCHLYYLFERKTNPEADALVEEAQALLTIAKYKEIFFRDTEESEKTKKKLFWKLYLYPYLTAFDMNSESRTTKAIQLLIGGMKRRGYTDQALLSYDCNSCDPPAIDKKGVREFINTHESEKGVEWRRILYYYESSYERFFQIRHEFFKLRKELFDTITSKHPDVSRIEFPTPSMKSVTGKK